MDNTNTNENNHQDRTFYSFLAFLSCIPMVWGFINSSKDVILTLLLAIPYIIQLIIWFYGFKKIYEKEKTFLMRVFCFMVCFSVFPYSCAWVFYNGNENEPLILNYGEWFSYLCLIFIFGLVIVLLFLTYLLIHPEKSSLKNYRDGLKQLHFFALMHFFAIFLSIAFLAGFALAFHNKANKNQALFMEKLEFDESADPHLEPDDYSNCTCLYFVTHTANSDGATLEFREDEPPAIISGTDQDPIERRKHLNWVLICSGYNGWRLIFSEFKTQLKGANI